MLSLDRVVKHDARNSGVYMHDSANTGDAPCSGIGVLLAKIGFRCAADLRNSTSTLNQALNP